MSTIKKAIITAAGRGTRHYPATKTIQKELFPLVDLDGYTKPTLQIIAQECVDSGIEEICFVANSQNADAIREHFSPSTPSQLAALQGKEWAQKLSDNLTNLSKRVHIVVQHDQEGFGHAVYQAHEWAGDNPVLVLLGDHIYVPKDGFAKCSEQLIDAYAKWQAPISSVDIVGAESVYRLGVIRGESLDGDSYKALRIVEKPTIEQASAELTTPGLEPGKYLAHFGIHAFPSAIFDKIRYLIDHNIRRKDEFQLTSAQELLLEDSPMYIAQRINGYRYDTGQPEELIITQLAYALKSPYRSHVLDFLRDTTP